MYIYGLSHEYWRLKILFSIDSSVGTAFCSDATTSKPNFYRTAGHFVRAFVDIDLTFELKYKVLVEIKRYVFFVELDYDNFPDFYSNCRIIGHNIKKCRRTNKKDHVRRQEKPAMKEWVEKQKNVEIINIEEEIHQDGALEKENQEKYNLASKEVEVENLNTDLNKTPVMKCVK
jgi:hypothetical protein